MTTVSMHIGTEAWLSWVKERIWGEDVEAARSTTQALLREGVGR